MPQQRLFAATFRVYYEDTDAGGVMYHARYLNFFERARTEWLRQLGINQSQLAKRHDLVFAIRHVQVNYRRPARLDDCLQVSCEVADSGLASLKFSQRMHNQDGQLLAEARVEAACVRASDFKPLPWRKTVLAQHLASVLSHGNLKKI